MSGVRFLPLDGLRAAAFAAVFAHHALGVPLLWAGVDMFFVLSGYLITRILLSARSKARYYRNFYLARSFRIFPAYYLVLAFAVLLFGSQIWRDLPWALSYTVNVQRALIPGDGPLTPLWSLAVEEQFYLLWPLVIAFVPRRRLASLIIVLLAVAPIGRLLIATTVGTTAAGTLIFCRADGLLLGAAIALLAGHDAAPAYRAAAQRGVVPLGIGFAASAYAIPQTSVWFPVAVYTLAAWFFAAILVIVLNDAPRWLSTILTLRGVVYVGRISYGLYLFHMPVLYFVREHMAGTVAVAGVSAVATFALAAASWHGFEKPLLDLRHRYFDDSAKSDRVESFATGAET